MSSVQTSRDPLSPELVTAFLAVAVAIVGQKILAFQNISAIEEVWNSTDWERFVPFTLAAITIFGAIEYWRITNLQIRLRAPRLIIMYLDLVVVSFTVVALDGYANAVSTTPDMALNATLRNATICLTLFLFLGLVRYLLVATLSKTVKYSDVMRQTVAHALGAALALGGCLLFHNGKTWPAFLCSLVGVLVIVIYLIELSRQTPQGAPGSPAP